MNGAMLKIFPLENDPNNKWVNPHEFHKLLGHGTENAELFDDYILALKEGIASSDFQKATEKVERIAAFQKSISHAIIPSETHAKLEIFYNKANIFKSLFPFYLMIGIVLVGMFFLETFKPQFELKTVKNILLGVLIVGFVIQTIGLIIRWYISGHAPWSNGYESMIYISWATLLAGFIFMKKSYITLGVTAVLAGITLLTAHMSWLNPELTNLVPVLKSYWLTIHVATITASYGFLALGCMVAFLNLCTMIFRTEKNYERINLILRELTLIIEMSLSVGLILLIIGNFLGGIWANESWGRYWGWDPKETWTLVTIVLYSFTLHLTLIPSIRNAFSFNFFSAISFGGVLMTYFGVNYYLSGLHSYASGDSVPVPNFVYYMLGIFFTVSILAAYNEFRFQRDHGQED
jgi:cytochrome c-type biogenesis protein CcsB